MIGTGRLGGVAGAVAFAAAVAGASATLGAGCAGAPWFLGEPLDGKPAIPPTSRAQTVADHRRKLGDARARGEKVLELAALFALEQRGALTAADTRRLLDLLKERARDWIALDRPIPLVDDLRHIVTLEPGRARALGSALRSAGRAAGDRWLAIGENGRAEEEYRRAERLGAPNMLFRLRAAWGASPADLDKEVLERALADLPERALAPFAAAYLDVLGAATRDAAAEAETEGKTEGETDSETAAAAVAAAVPSTKDASDGAIQRKLLHRAWLATRVYGPAHLRARIEALPIAADFTVPAEGAPPVEPQGGARTDILVEPSASDRLYGGATLARTLLPLARVFPGLSAPGHRSREWSDVLLLEDPTSPDSLEFAALVEARAGRVDGAGRKLGDLVFHSSDRAAGYARAARVWERSGEGRRACLAWDRAARFGAFDDPRWCALITCLRAYPGAGEAAAVAQYLRARAPHLACSPEAAPPPLSPLP